MTVVSAWCGASTSIGARVVTKVSGLGDVRLAVADNFALTDPVFFGPVTPDAQSVAVVDASGLDADTRYWWAVEHDSVLDEEFRGQFRTHPLPGQPASFTIGAASCAGGMPDVRGVGSVLASERLSNHPVFDTIRSRALAEEWLQFVHLGDLHYYDLGSGNHGIVGGASLANYRAGYDDVLTQPLQHQLMRDVPVPYAWDDHDYGPNDSDGTHGGKADAQQVYRERVPHYPLPGSAGAIYQSWQIGRVLFILSDVRSNRDPNSDPDIPGKTMLGEGQKTWMRNLLTASSAEFFVWLLPDQWKGTRDDSFASFTQERAELVGMFDELGWIGRMCIVSGDEHILAIDTGANSAGGIPVFQFAALDSDPTFSIGTYDLGAEPGRNHYGTIEITDDGNVLTVTGTGWIGGTLWRSHTITAGEPEPEPQPDPGLTLPAGVASPVVTWIGCDLVTGRIVADLPDLTGTVSRILGEYTSTGLSMPIPLSGPAALGERAFAATTPGRSLIVAVVNGQPAWGGMVLTQNAGTENQMEIGCATVEAYLQRRRVRDHTFTQADQATIAAALLGDASTILGVGSGIGLEIDAPPTGVLRDRDYKATDRATVYKRLQELAGVQNGIEWTIELLWGDETETFVRKVVRVRNRIGIESATPAAIFETTAASVFESAGGNEARYSYDEDYSDGRGANYVVAYSSGQGDDQPASAPAVDAAQLAAGFPIYERHWQPASNIRSIPVLNQHAERELALRRNGARTWHIEARWNVTPRLNLDWRLGDDVAWQLIGHRHPSGVNGQGRCIGWELDPGAGTVTPILLDPASNEEA